MNQYLHHIFCAVCLAAFIGCAGSPINLATLSPTQLATQSDLSLANGYSRIRDTDIRSELERRKVFTQQEWQLIDTRSMAVGMSELALIASKGVPSIYGGVNTTVTASGPSKQYIYRETNYHKPSYVYVENGKVTAYQL
jgi:hypothetical protein